MTDFDDWRPSCQDVAMYVSYLILCCLVVCLAQGQEGGTNSSDNTDRFIDLRTNLTVDIEKLCKETPCLVKCCPMGQILLSDENSAVYCIGDSEEKYGVNSSNDYSESVEIYNKDIKKNIMKTTKNVMNFTLLFNEKFYNNVQNCCINVMEYFEKPKYEIYVTEDGRLMTMRFNYVNNVMTEMKPGEFCFEHQINLHGNGTIQSPRPEIAFYELLEGDESESFDHALVSACSMLVSCGFMLLVLLVYALLKELRNMAGMILMADVATLTAAFLIRAIQVIGNEEDKFDTNQCIILSLLLVYTLSSSFTWMNVMSFDIWWSMRGFRKSRRIHKRGIPVKFAWYCLYAWGVPLVPVLFIVIVEHLDLRHLPNFVKPHILVEPDLCFFAEDERQLYVNGPILIATFMNIVLFLMTAYNIWRIKRGVSQSAESQRNKKDETRFGIYLKLSMVMGISWILEVLSSLVYPTSHVWYITDIYNTLLGLFIFIIFVCKRNIFHLLCKRFQIENEYVKRWGRESNSTKSTNTRAGKRNVLESVTESSDTGDTPDRLNSVKYS